MNEKELLKRIETNPKIMLGKPVIKGTRLPVEIILEKLGYGYNEEEIIKDFPFLKREDIKACLIYAAKRVALVEEVIIE